ncbi:putative outer membrane repeat protein [Pseudofulvimonas gallinarii]|uniref:Putative outer membrane repeat protein n=2 Tax=Pseudofulvimonas gallinarii TaxID=634155 RepID=A0A4R3LMZ9_9GAMM|nr:putative outer membrane repeat protein [Pseudofulvimonas gallinarii]
MPDHRRSRRPSRTPRPCAPAWMLGIFLAGCVTDLLAAPQGTDCSGISFPYVLSGPDNAARIAELRQAIECAEANATADVIDLGGTTLLFINADPSSGDTALPNIASAITLRNGTLQRDAAAAEFRLLTIEGPGEFRGETLTFRNGLSHAGGAIYNSGVMELRDVEFINNGDRALTAEGGAIFHGAMDPLRIIDSRFVGNAATSGGAVFVSSGDVWIRGSMLQGNQADEGGAIFSQSFSIRLFDNAFLGNHALRGGAIKTLGARISGTRFEGNTADERGGAISMEGGFVDLFLVNSLLIGNQAPDGAAMVATGAMSHLHNVTINGHPAGAGSLLLSDGDEIVLANSIAWGNNGRPLGTATVRHSLVEGGYPGGTSILDLDPRFVDAANGDFRLAANSPAIDAGNNADVHVDNWWDIDDDGEFDDELDDLAGNPRRHDDAGVVDTGVGTAPIVDLGAYERQTSSSTAGISVNPDSGLVTTEAGGSATFTVVLATQPSANVILGVVSSDPSEGSASPATLDFSPIDWNVPQTVTVTGVDDFVVDGPTLYEISVAPVSSADPAYAGVEPAIVSVTNIDNDIASFTIQSGALVTTEAGGTDTFTVVLNAQPSADVIFDLSSTDPGEGMPSPASLVFTPGNWNVAQTATVTGVDDFVVDGNINYAILLYTTSADPLFNGIGPGVAYATNMDDDTAGIIVDPTSGLVTTEGFGPTGSPGIDQFSVVLTSEPTADVVIGLSSSDMTEGTVSVASLTFTAANWNVAQHVDVYSVDDYVVDGDITYTIVTAAAVSADPNYDGLDPADVTVTNRDNDTAGITINPTSGLVTTEAGGTASFTVVLNTQPSADVTIGLSSSDTTEGTVAPASLTFTAANWNIMQTVTVTGVDDNEVDGDVAYTIVTAAAVSADPNYDGLDPADVSVTNTDDDSAGITVNPTSGLATTEGGGTATFTVALNSQPGADVVIGLSSSDTTEGTVAPTSLTFTAANWNNMQTVTVTGVDDNEVDGDIAYTVVTAAAVSADPNYDGLDPADVSVTNTDDDSAGITVNPTSGLVTTEGGGTATFTVVLNSQPGADVVIGLSSSDTTEGTVAPTSLTFTAANWNNMQTVTVTGVDDNEVDGDIAYTVVTAAAVSADPDYNGVDPDDVAVTNIDDDSAGITINPTGGLVTTEAGGSATFTVALNTQPGADVAIGLSSSDTTEGTVSPGSVTFTAANWNVPQMVTVTGVDDNEVDGDITYTIVTAAAVSADPDYNGVDPDDVAVTNIDDDSAGITINPTGGLVTTEAGGSATFTVALNTQPGADVAIGLSSSDTTEGTVSPGSVTFTAANWNVPQMVTVTGVDDNEVDGDITYTIVTAAAVSADPDYNGVDPDDVAVTNIDDDSAGIMLAASSGSLVTSEMGDSDSFTAVLTTMPSADVILPIASSDSTEGTASPGSLVFTPGNWNVPQTVTVTGLDDAQIDGDQAYRIQVGPASSADTTYSGMTAWMDAVNIDDDVALGSPPRPVPFGGIWVTLVLLLTMLALASETLARRR